MAKICQKFDSLDVFSRICLTQATFSRFATSFPFPVIAFALFIQTDLNMSVISQFNKFWKFVFGEILVFGRTVCHYELCQPTHSPSRVALYVG
jgi:hypothetical protein